MREKHKDILEEQKRIIARQDQIITEHLATIANHENMIRIQNKLFLEADKTLKTLLELLTTVVELRDPYTKGHSHNVSALAVRIAQQESLLFPANNLLALKYGALLHDIGKIAISDFVLSKSTLLTDAEMTMIQQHTNIGYKLVVPLDFDPIVAEIILYHHENYDGSGYPSKLKANDIPLAARIVRVADVYDALTSNRPYRSAYSKKEAIRIIEKENSQFDPQVLSILYKIVLEKKSNTSKSKAG